MVAASTPSACLASLYSSMRSAEMSDKRSLPSLFFSFLIEHAYRFRVFACETILRKSSAQSSKLGGVDFGG
jgi:hypothetical protein